MDPPPYYIYDSGNSCSTKSLISHHRATDSSSPPCHRKNPPDEEETPVPKRRHHHNRISMQTIAIPARVHLALRNRGFKTNKYGVVSWLENSPFHPRHWKLRRKAYDSAIICLLEFFMTLMSNAGSSITPEVGRDIGVGREVALICLTTTYLVGQGIGGLIFPPVAEAFGGRTIYVVSTMGYAVSCVVIAAAPRVEVVVCMRFLGGFLSAMPAVVAAGSIENMWDMTARIWVIYFWIAGAVLGLALGPPIATYAATGHYGWRSLFYASAIVTGILALLCLGMQESRPSKVLRNETKTVARKTSFDRLSVDVDDGRPDAKTFVKTTLVLPIRLFFTEPIVFFTSMMAATVYGVTYLFTEAFTVIYTNNFHFSRRETSLVFLAIGVGVAFTLLPRIYDARMMKKRQRQDQPEDKLFGFYIAAPVLAIGLWWCAFTVPPLVEGITPWPSIASLLLFGFSVVEFDNVLSGYLCDTYVSYSASANAPLAFLRAMLSGTFPLFGQQMFEGLGPNRALYVLAGVATGFCAVAALFFVYGKRIRERSPFAEKSLRMVRDAESGEERCAEKSKDMETDTVAGEFV